MKRVYVYGLALALAFSFGSSGEVKGAEKEFKWKMPFIVGPTGPYPEAVKACFDEIKEKSGGRLVIRPLWPGEHPYEVKDFLRIVTEGIVETSSVCNGHLTGYRDYFGVLPLPGLLVASDAKAARCSYEVEIPFYQKILREREGVFVASNYVSGLHHLASKKKVTSLNDVKGLVVRCQDSNEMRLMKSLGANPVSISFAECYMALSRGTIDGIMTGVAYIYNYKMFEPCKYALKIGTFANNFNHMVNIKAFNELPKDLQDIFIESSNKLTRRMQEEIGPADIENAWKGAVEKYNATVTALTPEEQRQVLEAGNAIVTEWLSKKERSKEAKELVSLVKNWLAKN